MKTRRPLIAGNWKMHKTGQESVDFVNTLIPLVSGAADVDIMIAPPFTALTQVAEAVEDTAIQLGAQNVHWESHGAYTGEISSDMLLAARCDQVIIGHSERRQYFGETDDQINRKINVVNQAGLTPVFCIGETEDQRDAGNTFSVLDKQVENGLENLVLEDLTTLVVAYEPVWAIGTGKTATTDQAQEVHAFLRTRIGEMYNQDLADGMRILYGGSVKPSNVKDLMSMPDIDGALVGGASLDPESFAQLVNFNR